MTFARPHERNDWIALEMARIVARRLREQPTLVSLGTERILNARKRGLDSGAYREWEKIITTHTVEEIAALLEQETEEGQRIRSSRPFIGPPFVTELERKQILERAFAE